MDRTKTDTIVFKGNAYNRHNEVVYADRLEQKFRILYTKLLNGSI